MNYLLITLALVLGWSQTGLAATAALTGDADAGKAASATCGACHGADGNSMVPSFPKLAGQGEKYLLKQLIDIRENNRMVPTMIGQLDGKTDQDLADLRLGRAVVPMPICWRWVRRCIEAALHNEMSPLVHRAIHLPARATLLRVSLLWQGSMRTI